jgi:hypothetical protein
MELFARKTSPTEAIKKPEAGQSVLRNNNKSYSGLHEAIASFHTNNGYAVPNRFEVIIVPPAKMSTTMITNLFSGSPRKIDERAVSLRCESISLPGRSLQTTEDTNIYGPGRSIVSGVTYAGEISLTFQARADLDERVFFEEWQKQTFNEQTWDVGYYNDYVSVMEIYLLDRMDRRRYGVKLFEVYPKEIGPTDLSQSANNEIIKNQINFQYRYWQALDENRKTPNGVWGSADTSGVTRINRANMFGAS